MKRLLVIAWFFPPMGGGGVQRTLSFVRHLSALGWRITVLTTDAPERYWAQDPGLLERVPASVEVVRVGDRALSLARRVVRRAAPERVRRDVDRLLDLPDRQATWRPYAIREGRRLLQAERFDAIYSTSAPWSAHLVAHALARRARVRWVADFRDPWTLNQTFRPATRAHARWAEAWEARILRDADVVLTNTPKNAAALQARFTDRRAHVEALPNGWEADETEGLGPPSAEGPLTIGYAGSFYAGYQPDAFYRHLLAAFTEAPALRSTVRVRMCGRTEQAQAAAAAGLADVVEERGYLPQRAALEHLAKSHAVLLTLPDAADSGWVPQKLYVYLRLDRPVIAVLPPGEARDILERAGGRQLVLAPDARDGGPRLAAFLRELGPRRTAPAGYGREVVQAYDRARLAARLDALLRGRVAPSGRLV